MPSGGAGEWALLATLFGESGPSAQDVIGEFDDVENELETTGVLVHLSQFLSIAGGEAEVAMNTPPARAITGFHARRAACRPGPAA